MPQYNLLLESIPSPLLYLILIVTLLATTLLSLLSSTLSPSIFVSNEMNTNLSTRDDMRAIFNGTRIIRGSVPFESSPLNQHILFFVQFGVNDRMQVLSSWSDEIDMYISVVGCDALEGCDAGVVWDPATNTSSTGGVPLTDHTKLHKKIITCQAPFTPPKTSCNSITLFNELTIRYSYYSVAFILSNQEEKIEWRLGKYDWGYSMGSSAIDSKYTLTDIVLKYLFVVVSACALLVFVYVAMVLRNMRWFQWQSEQKFIVILLGFLIFYNNPLTGIQYFMSNLFITFLSVLFKANFFAVLMFSFMVVLHSVYIKQQDRGTSFYVTKAILVGTLWACFMLTFMYSALQQSQDPTFTIVPEEQPVYAYVQWTLITMFFLYLVSILYYIVRILGLSFKLSSTASMKFKMVALVTIMLFSFLIIYLCTLNAFGELTQALTPITFNLVINFFVLLLAVLYLPSSTRRDISDVSIEESAMLGGL
mmetsp:Transcript_1266/g.4310  ORF Transcript_1266/g.4310 Transcript_1266/m.4310 type:complete len:478 (-) Transcript_1266:522-1955(-)|eukprot:CAMPEP_0117446298 /NCGR_PEP_ID=MMETSP0759-20121206/6263_1 /TAXON_ID=63605 /ORGANISM="Percolomonas cosmopolitus, Strain WS" /LENGTH=477 /DNA_ID=CAMNT_0005238549 /DNA_START=226 /DNA_END=1659 /DNA_ORIENTATION=+